MAVASSFELGSGPSAAEPRRATRAMRLVALPGIVVVPWLVAFAAPGLLLLAATEDGLIESTGALFYLLAGASFLAAALASRWRGLIPTLVLTGLAAIFLLSFGEEISWGQRLFDWETPSAIAAQNVQGKPIFTTLVSSTATWGARGR